MYIILAADVQQNVERDQIQRLFLRLLDPDFFMILKHKSPFTIIT